MKTDSNTHSTQRVMLVGTTRAPTKEVMKKTKALSAQLGGRSMVIVPSLLYSDEEKARQVQATQRAYGQGGVKVDGAIGLEQIPEIAAMDAPPMVLLAGGCPYTLIEKIRELAIEKDIRTIARKSMIAGACAGAMALTAGTHLAEKFNKVTGFYHDVDRTKVAGMRGMELIDAQMLPMGDKLSQHIGEHRPEVIAHCYISQNPYVPVMLMDGGSGFYAEKVDGQNQTIESLGKTQIINPNVAKVREENLSVLKRGERPFVAMMGEPGAFGSMI